MYYKMKCDSSKIGSGWKVVGIISMVIGFVFIIIGFDKYHIDFTSFRNNYVGGDAYNLMINAGRSTAMFVFAGVCEIIGIGSLVLSYLSKLVHINNLLDDDKINN